MEKSFFAFFFFSSYFLTVCFLVFIKLNFVYGGQKKDKSSSSCARVVTQNASLGQSKMIWVYEHENWPKFFWNEKAINFKLDKIYQTRNRVFENLKKLGFHFSMETPIETQSIQDLTFLNALTNEIVRSFSIEGEHLDLDDVRSSIAHRFGIEVDDLNLRKNHKIDSFVNMALDAIQNYNEPLTSQPCKNTLEP